MLDLGKIMITPEGMWNEKANYEYLSLVYYDGSSYVARKDNSGVVPGTDDTVWQCMGNGLSSGEAVGYLPVELYATFSEGVSKLYIRAPKGVIDPATDTLTFARRTSLRPRVQQGDPKYRVKGWIRPRTHNYIWLRLIKSASLSNVNTEYFEILPSVANDTVFYNQYNIVDYDSWPLLALQQEEYIDSQRDYLDREGNDYGGSMPARLDRRCGICLMRDGVQVSPYLPFRMVKHGDRDWRIRVR